MLVGNKKKIILKHVVGMATWFIPETFDFIGTKIAVHAIVGTRKKLRRKIQTG